jgi:LacI family transcriptional regulator
LSTLADVARLAGVSTGIVSRVLNEDQSLRVRDATRSKIFEAAEKLDYTPNHAARALRRSRVGVIGLAVHDASNPLYEEIIAGAQAEAMSSGSMLVLADIDALATNEKVFKRVISSGALDGLVLQRAGTASDVLVSRIASERLPMVLLNDRTEAATGSVAADDFGAAHLATRQLIELGHHSIGLLRLTGDHMRANVRSAGWAQALREAGIEPDLNLVREGGQTVAQGYDGMVELIRARVRVSAVLVANVLAAVGALRACADHGVAVPGDLAIIAVHDADIAAHTIPRLSVVRLPLFEMGRMSVRLLLEQLEGHEPRHVTLTSPEPVIVLRESTGRVER